MATTDSINGETAIRLMRKLDLREYEQSSPYTLSVAERDNLRDAVPNTGD